MSVKAHLANGDVLLTAHQVAELTGYELKTLRNWRAIRKNIPFVLLQGEPRYWRSEVTAWMLVNLVPVLECREP